MARQRVQLTPDAASALQAAEFAEKNGPTRARIQAVRLHGLGFAVVTVHTVTGISRSRVLECCRAYRARGIPALADHRQGSNTSKLTAAQVTEMQAKLAQYTPRSLFGPDAATPTGQFWMLADLKRAVERWYHVTYDSPTSY